MNRSFKSFDNAGGIPSNCTQWATFPFLHCKPIYNCSLSKGLKVHISKGNPAQSPNVPFISHQFCDYSPLIWYASLVAPLKQQCAFLFLRKTRFLIDLNHCVYIFLRTSSAQDSNSFSLICLQSMGMEKESFSKIKTKGDPKNIQNSGGKASMHKSTSILDFFKRDSRPPSGGSFTACGILLLAILIRYANTDGNSCRLWARIEWN